MKEFNTAIEESERDDETMEFKIDGQLLRAYRPTDGQLALLMASLGRHTNEMTKVAGVIDFFVTVMDDESYNYVVNRLLSREDALGLEQVQGVIEWMIEEWSGRPTQPLSVSTPSRQSGGPKSKPRTTKSTSSKLAPASSST
jgi:hypothetical protein